MSHAANLRSRQQATLASPKRRRLSQDLSISHVNGANGLLNGLSSKKLGAAPTRDLKARSRKPTVESEAALRHGEQDLELADASASGDDLADGSDDEDVEEEDSDDDENESESEGNGVRLDRDDEDMIGQADQGAQERVDEQNEEPSFGDLLRSKGPEPISVDLSAHRPDVQPSTLATRTLSVPSATSLGTVLTQALKTNDLDLLESCLQVPNLDSIRATIERLHSAHAAVLLRKLAERMHKRPGRAGSLMVWVQWTIVAHGSYLASQPAAMRQLQTLYQVVKQRASGLQPLLALKGKLDMLEAQMQLRRNMQGRSKRQMSEDDTEGIIYVEGEEDEDEQLQEPAARAKQSLALEDDSEDDELMPLVNGTDLSDNDEEEEEGSSDEDADLIDDEAEESDDDSDNLSEEVDFENDDDEEEDDEGEEPPTKRSKSTLRK